MDFDAEYERVRRMKDPARRGKAAEAFVCDVLVWQGFDVTMNAGAGLPRQTDLYATKAGDRYLIEVKWERRPAGTPEVDEVRLRLMNAPRGPVGVVVSFAGFADPAITQVRAKRHDYAVLLVDADEIERVGRGAVSMHELLQMKFEYLVRDAVVHTSATAVPSVERRTVRIGPDMPTAGRARDRDRTIGEPHAVQSWYTDAAGEALPWLVGAGGYSAFVPTTELLGRSWSTLTDTMFALEVSLGADDEDELGDVVERLNAARWIASDADWTIQQGDRSWTGIGVGSCLDAVRRREERYVGLTAHHTEELRVYSSFDGGYLTLSADLSVARNDVRHAALSMRFDGVPVDVSGVSTLLQDVASDTDGLAWKPVTVGEPTRLRRGRDVTEPLDVLGYQVQRDTEDGLWVTGVVVDSPFTKADADVLGVAGPSTVEQQHIVCALRDQHPLADGLERVYTLRSLDSIETSDSYIVRAVADW